jgi:hypothetical protein
MAEGKTVTTKAPLNFRFGKSCNYNATQIVGYREVPAVPAHIELLLANGGTHQVITSDGQKDFLRQRPEIDKWLATLEARNIASAPAMRAMSAGSGS